MHVVATAGHVDHGKSTLVKALTGVDPDRLEEESRRGLSIELGYCWTSLDPVGDIAFVDVPGHERFISTMLSGIGPVPAVLFVVAADDPWMPQAAEHLAALDALGVSSGVVAVTRSDLADPTPACERAAHELSRTSLRGSPVVAVSGRTGQGLDRLRSHLATMVAALPAPDPSADVRFWVDRRFSIRGAGTVVTGTLPTGRVCAGDSLSLGSHLVRVRGVQCLGAPTGCADGVARVALNVTGEDLSQLDRGSALLTPDAWHLTGVVDVRLGGSGSPSNALGRIHGARPAATSPPERPLLHLGATSVTVHCRPLAEGLFRLKLDRLLPLRVGDRALLRDPGTRAIWGLTVLDPAPPPLRRRGAAAERASTLMSSHGEPELASELQRRGVVHAALLRRIGVPTDGAAHNAVRAGGWLMSEARASSVAQQVERMVRDHGRASPLDLGLPLGVLAERLDLPSPELVRAVVRSPLQVNDGRVTLDGVAALPAHLEAALEELAAELARSPFAAPIAGRLEELGLDHRAVAAAARAGRLLRLAEGVVLLPGADLIARQWLAEISQPFTTSEARVRLDTSRRVVLPLLAHLDKVGHTRRLPDDRRIIVD